MSDEVMPYIIVVHTYLGVRNKLKKHTKMYYIIYYDVSFP